MANTIKVPEGTAQDVYSFMCDPIDKSMFVEPVFEQEIISIVKNCKSKSSSDCYGLNMKVLKQVIDNIVKPFTYICNQSFYEGVFPDKLKIAKVVPLFKSGEKCKFTNYRPVSLLPQFSKVLEKLYCNRLNKFIKHHNVLVDSQYGFRNEHSTSLALIDLIEELTNSIDDKKITIGIFIDLKKAFDTINHELLLHKLERYGIRGTALSWLSSYLNNRKQYVSYNGTSSSSLDISCGVPQGSILGPVLFILYINDLCNVSQFLKFVLFADDTNLFASGNNMHDLCERINQELIKVNIWFKINKLSLNLSKTNFILFTKRNVADSQLKINIEGVVITRVYECKFLGVIIDSKLNWHSHCALVKNKLLKCNAILMKASMFLNSIAMRTLYSSLFLPYINYCCEVWGITNKGTIDPLVKLQKKRQFALFHMLVNMSILMVYFTA